MNIIGSFIARFNNSKGNLFNLNKKNKTNNLEIDIIIHNIIKIRKDDDLDFLDNKNDFKRENKREGRFYNRKNNNKNKKIQITKLNKYYEKKKKFKF